MMEEVKAKEAKFNKKNMFKPDSTASKRTPDKKFNLTKEKIETYLPRGSSHKVTDEIVKLVGSMEEDTGLPQDLMEEELLGYLHLAAKVPRTKLKELINAVKYCNLKRNYDNKKAWSIVFPDKYDKLVDEDRQIDSHVAMYNQSALVVEIDKEMLIPFHLQYQPYFHAAVKKQYDLMNGRAAPNSDGEAMSVTPMVQHLASKALMEVTAMPQEAKIDLTISKGAEEIDLQKEMNRQLADLVIMQKRRLDAGESIDTVQQIGLNLGEALEGELI